MKLTFLMTLTLVWSSKWDKGSFCSQFNQEHQFYYTQTDTPTNLIHIKCSKSNPFSLTKVAKILKVIWRQFAKYILNIMFHRLISTGNIYILILWFTETDACIVSFLYMFLNSICISWFFMVFLLQLFNQRNSSSLCWPPSHIEMLEMLTGNIKLEPVQQ